MVNKSCSDAIIYDAVEKYDSQHAKCFDKCPQRQMGSAGAVRNTSTPCYIYCFYATALGSAALMPGGQVGGGMSLDALSAAFEKARTHTETELGTLRRPVASPRSEAPALRSRPPSDHTYTHLAAYMRACQPRTLQRGS